MDTPTTTLAKYQMYIDGQWVDSASNAHFESDNPFLGKPWALIPRGNAADADRAVQAARNAFTSGEWPKCNATKRGALLRKLGDLITEKSKTPIALSAICHPSAVTSAPASGVKAART